MTVVNNEYRTVTQCCESYICAVTALRLIPTVLLPFSRVAMCGPGRCNILCRSATNASPAHATHAHNQLPLVVAASSTPAHRTVPLPFLLLVAIAIFRILSRVGVKVKFCPHPSSFSQKSSSRSLLFRLRVLGPPVPRLLLPFALPSEFASCTLRASRCPYHRAICLAAQP
jgi:hypothetical protein